MSLFVALALPAWAAEKATLFVTAEQGFGRMILSFPGLYDMPKHQVKVDNGVLAVTFDEPIELTLPDVSKILPDYISVARVDPDGRGVRFALRTKLNFNPIDAGEKLFLDLMPMNWQGLPPSLPPEVVADMARRAEEAAQLAEQKRLAEQAAIIKPTADLRIGRNPTFTRLQFDWSAETKASFKMDMSNVATLTFNWPVPVEIWPLKADMPAEIKVVDNQVGPAGSAITFRVAEGVTPRFYATSDRQFIVDLDVQHPEESKPVDAAALLEAEKPKMVEASASQHGEGEVAGPLPATITPFFSSVGSTVRVVFPFPQDTPAAVFRRGDALWMVFDTMTGINPPPANAGFDAIAKSFTIVPSGDSQVVRLELNGERLATLGSQGKAWVLSLGDALLTPTEPLALNRRLDAEGSYEMTADLQRPGRVHEFADPVVGDTLTVVTAYPPARGMTRDQAFVDFSALRSVHGLVVRPNREGVDVNIDSRLAVIHSPAGLTVSSLDTRRISDFGTGTENRSNYVNLSALEEPDPTRFEQHRDGLLAEASQAEGKSRDLARLDLARLLVANRFGVEALGVLKVMEDGLSDARLKGDLEMTRAIANAEAYRGKEAMQVLGADAMADDMDALLWRTIVRADDGDYRGARSDSMGAEGVLDGYPAWVRSRFLLASIRAAVETNDVSLASHYMGMVDIARLEPEQVSELRLLSGRVDELSGRNDEALDSYGQVIAADYRPSRAEAVYRTLAMLQTAGRIDPQKAIETLAAESMLWRGGEVEAQMQRLLAELYFQQGQFRNGFEVAKQAALYHGDSAPAAKASEEASTQFADLYLNGRADGLDPVEALSLFYDFRELTPPGARGDEMIRNLAKRLVKVDLLAQAADLLQYQIDNRLKGVAQAQVGADLAVIQIANRNPEAALQVLNKTRLADLAPPLERQRRVLEARAMIDAGRDDLALDMLSRMKGRDIDLLRVDAHWKAKRYDKASELMEALYAPGPASEPMATAGRMAVVKAAVGYVLSNDALGLSRIRTKFGEQMANSPEWAMFDFVTSQISSPSPAEFKQVAKAVSGMDSLNAFLDSYHQIYGGQDALVPEQADKAAGAA